MSRSQRSLFRNSRTKPRPMRCHTYDRCAWRSRGYDFGDAVFETLLLDIGKRQIVRVSADAKFFFLRLAWRDDAMTANEKRKPSHKLRESKNIQHASLRRVFRQLFHRSHEAQCRGLSRAGPIPLPRSRQPSRQLRKAPRRTVCHQDLYK